ncbi:plasmid mobilization protein, partial [Escherichia coli]
MCICRTAHAQSDKCHLVRALPRHPGKEQTMSEKKTRTGSENRKRIVKFTARFTEDEAEIVREKAESSGQTVSTFIRS